MTLSAAIYNILINDDTITDVIGVSPSAKLYLSELPQDPVFPAVVMSEISSLRESTLQGPTGYVHARLQIDSLSVTASGSKGLSDLIRVALNGKRFIRNGCKIGSIILQSIRDVVSLDIDVSIIYNSTSDYIIWYLEV